ncbi:MAG: sialate O-acetylesterase, partial [Kiritimatiellia bacterium]
WRGGDPGPNEHDSSFNQEWVHLLVQPKGNPGRRGPGNFGQAEGGFGPEMGFARTLLDAQPDRPLAIVKVAYNATGVSAWRPGTSIYRTLISETNLAIEKAKAQGITLRPRAFLWCQGETDSNRNPDTDAYRDELESIISTLRKDLDAPEMIALLGFNTRFGKRASKRSEPRWENQRIINAQKQIAENSDYAVWVNDWGVEIANQAHFSAKGTLEVGERYAKALLEAEANLKR